MDEVLNSAMISFEKSSPEAQRTASGQTSSTECLMIGDSPEADVFGAERSGQEVILARNVHPGSATAQVTCGRGPDRHGFLMTRNRRSHSTGALHCRLDLPRRSACSRGS